MRRVDPQSALGEALADIVDAAAALVLPLWRSGLKVDRKADDSPVTEADRRAETLILTQLQALDPGAQVISEEDASDFGTPEAIGPRFYLVDPVDGTKAFVRGDEHWTVNIALIQDGRPVAGAVCAPALGRTWFTAAVGAKARSVGQPGGTPIRARPWPAGAAVALVSHTMKPVEEAELRRRHGYAEVRAMDSSVKLCLLAEGLADIYPRQGPTMEWDIAAGHAVLAAAGGRVEAPDGAPFLYGKADRGFRNGPFIARGG